jgi:hypothetical protein
MRMRVAPKGGSLRGFARIAFCLLALYATGTAFAGTAAGVLPKQKVGREATLDAIRNRGKDEASALLFLATDKPIYQPGETVYARAVALLGDSYFPLREEGNKSVVLIISGPRQNEVFSLETSVVNSTAGFSWNIPSGIPGGRYEATVRMRDYAREGYSPPAKRVFEIRAYAQPRLKSQIVFLREGYGPGDTVTAVASVTRAEGGIPVGARVTAVARVDEKEVARVDKLAVDAEGNCKVSFPLPAALARGEGTLAIIIEDGGQMETASKTIPIILQTLDLSFYPEGGESVADLPGRIYVQARRPDGKPADVEGEIVRIDAAGAALNEPVAAELRTLHEGRGIVALTPLKGERYALRLRRPAGVDRLFPLPPARSSGVSLRAERESYPFDQAVTLRVAATRDSGAARVTLFHRGRLVAECPLQEGEDAVSLHPGEAEGILIATVWDRDGRPLAERLIFRQPRYALRLGVTVEALPEGSAPLPGGKIRLTLEARDETGRPVEAVVGLSVTDDALLEMVEKRDQAPDLPVMAYLENEVKDLADAHVYLDAAHPDAARNLDLLLGVQGWRRFVLVGLDEALRRDPDAVKRAFAVNEPLSPAPSAGPVLIEDQPRLMARRVDKMVFIADEEAPAILEENRAMAEKKQPAFREPLHLKEPRELGEMKQFLAPAPESEPPIVIREYAHTARAGRRPNDRADFTETLYWHAGIRTNPRDGTATVAFELSDSVTTFRVRADAFGNNGALGSAAASMISREPFHLEAKLPPFIVAGDKVTAPVVLINATPQSLDRTGFSSRGEGLRVGAATAPSVLPPDSRTGVPLSLQSEQAGSYILTLNSSAGPYADSLTRRLTVLPRGFPVQQTASGLIGPKKPFARTFAVTAELIPGSMHAEAKVYPTPLANMEEALNALLRRPSGCFEQTSSTNFPLVMAQQYFMSHSGVSPKKIKKAGILLEEGYKKLVGFESPSKGYEWFGGDPGHEALTAYGLMQFTEMEKIMPVDREMLERTRRWLLARRDGAGGFKRSEQALDTFGAAPVPLTNLYILWTLLESGEKAQSLQSEIQAAKKLVAATNDSYLLALGVNIFYLAGERVDALAAASMLQRVQGKDGSLAEAQTSITRSRGEALHIETASLAILGWLRCGEDFAGSVEASMGWLFERCKAGRFGNTQSTILALKAINAYDMARAKPKAAGSVRLRVDGRDFGHPVAFSPDTQGALLLPDFSAALSPGEHRLELIMDGGADMPFSLEIAYATPQPEDSLECPLRLATSLSAAEVREGEPLELRVRVTAKEEDVSLPVAVIGLPAGMEPRHERLKELTAAGRIAAYEVKGRELTLYWRGVKGGESVELSLPLTAEVPGEYTAPASRAYAFYHDEHVAWIAGEKATVVPRADAR